MKRPQLQNALLLAHGMYTMNVLCALCHDFLLLLMMKTNELFL